MIRRLCMAMAFLICSSFVIGADSANVAGPIRGVTFFYLDGANQDFNWVLENLNNTTVQAKLQNLFIQYQNAGVNWVRLLISPDFLYCGNTPPPYPDLCSTYPALSPTLVSRTQQFISMLATYGFKVEFNMDPHMDKNNIYFCGAPYSSCDDPYYYNAKSYFDNWINNLDFNVVGMVMLGNSLRFCDTTNCDRTGSTNPQYINNGEWIINIWAWKQKYHPNMPATYETVGIYGNHPNDTSLIFNVAQWAVTRTPGIPYVALSLYVTEPPGSGWSAYATDTDNEIDVYRNAVHGAGTTTPLWIDEFGGDMSLGTGRTQTDQLNSLLGFLGGSVCQVFSQAPKFLWVTGNDYPSAGTQNTAVFGVVSSFTSAHQPVMRPGWNAIDQWYNLSACP